MLCDNFSLVDWVGFEFGFDDICRKLVFIFGVFRNRKTRMTKNHTHKAIIISDDPVRNKFEEVRIFDRNI